VTRVAAFDCGTNSLRMLIADLDPETRRSREIVREMRIVRLGEGVDRTGRISDVALHRVLGALDEFAALAAKHEVQAVRFCATSAARDAENVDDLVAGVDSRLGVRAQILDGDEEARLSFAGAIDSLRASLPTPYLVIDIGGGSTELILGEQEVQAAQSLDIGSVRLTERHLRDDPPSKEQIAAAVADIDTALDGSTVDPADAGAVIGVAGTVTTIAAGALSLTSYDRQVIHHSVIDKASVQGTVASLLAMTVEQRRAKGYMHPGRADVIGGGGLILDRVLRRATAYSMLVSEHDILDGIAWSMA
jgi:exopolyphosphatase / guanosine-5'-triphosphate,3'-diphosphate pyrophosphatase